MSGAGLLLVAVGARRLALPLEDVLEVVAVAEVFPVPALEPAMRGVTPYRGRLVPLFHLGALLERGGCPAEGSSTGVMAALGGRTVCLEVGDAAEVAWGEVTAAGGESLPGTAGLARLGEEIVPVLDMAGLRERVLRTGTTT